MISLYTFGNPREIIHAHEAKIGFTFYYLDEDFFFSNAIRFFLQVSSINKVETQYRCGFDLALLLPFYFEPFLTDRYPQCLIFFSTEIVH